MKTLILILTLSLAACGKNNDTIGPNDLPTGINLCQSPINGQWQRQNDTALMTLNNDCTGYDNYCGRSFRYSQVLANSGQVTVQMIGSVAQGDCLAPGTYTCAYNYNATNLALDCGPGPIYFIKQ